MTTGTTISDSNLEALKDFHDGWTGKAPHWGVGEKEKAKESNLLMKPS